MSTPTSSSTPVPPPTSNKPLSKSSKPSKRVILRLAPQLLAKFPSAQPLRKASRSKPPTINTTTAHVSSELQADSIEVKAESEHTPLPDLLPESTPREPTPIPLKRKGIPGPKPGSIKRTAPTLDANGLPKPRGKPGPKKRIRVDGETSAPVNGLVPVPHHKLGPKANQGAINAGLRALDRTGKPTRKWLRNGFQVKSFTGVKWEVPSWRAPTGIRMDFGADAKSNSTASSEDAKAGNASSMPSEKSNSGGDIAVPDATTSSAGFILPPVGTETLLLA